MKILTDEELAHVDGGFNLGGIMNMVGQFIPAKAQKWFSMATNLIGQFTGGGGGGGGGEEG